MLDVHPVHERISGFRDFLLHLLTITIGLLIALGLEASVELAHHRDVRIEATENLKREIEDNRKDVAGTRSKFAKQREDLNTVRSFLQARSRNQPFDGNSLTVSMTLSSLRNASWSTASATGALSYMAYSDVKKYAAAYELQTEFENVQRLALGNVLVLQSYFSEGVDPDKLPASEAEAAKAEVRLMFSHLVAMDQLGSSLDQAYDAALK